MELQQLPSELIDRIILPKYLCLDNYITLEEKLYLSITYKKLDLVNSQITYHFKEFHYLKNVPRNYWNGCRTFYFYIIKKNKWKKEY